MIFAPVKPAATRALSMPRSAIREIMALAAGRPEVIHLEVGEPDGQVDPAIIERTCEALRAGWTRYAPVAGLFPLRELVAARYTARWSEPVAVERVVITTGAIAGLYSSLMTVLDAGDEVLIPDPGWPNYESICHLAGARPVRYRLDPAAGYVPSIAEIERLTTSRTKAILINTPGNPTGAVFPEPLMRHIAEHVRAAGLYLISDEIYEDMVFEGAHASAAKYDIEDRLFVISGVSKSYAMTGFRLGFLICPPALATVAASLQEPITSGASSPSQKAAEAALTGDQSGVGTLCDTFRRRCEIFCDAMGPELLPVRPLGAFYALIDISTTGMRSLEFCKLLLAEDGVATVPGITFGPASDGTIRVAFSANEAALTKAAALIRKRIAATAERRAAAAT